MTTPANARRELSKVQAKVMHWLSQGWDAHVSHGSAVEINGVRICNVATLSALERFGLVFKDPSGLWSATEAGRRLSPKFGEVVDD